MHISVSGKHMEVGTALQGHIEEKLSHGITKYLEQVTDASVVISRESHLFVADIVINPGTHSQFIIKSQGEGVDAYVAFDTAAEKLEKQLRRYKRKLRDHQRERTARAKHEQLAAFTHYVISDENEEEAIHDNPVVIAEQDAHIDVLTVGEAVMRLDLESTPLVVFQNAANGHINIVFRRADGNIVWMDPKKQADASELRKAG